MINLLPPEERKALVREFQLRLVVVAVFLATSATTVSSLFLVPWFVSARASVQVLEEQNVREATTDNNAPVEPPLVLKETNEHVARLRHTLDTPTVQQFIEAALRARTDAVSLTDVRFTYAQNGGASLVLVGTANQRADLVEYRDALKKVPQFSAVVLPFTDLAKSKDLSFTLTLTPVLPTATSSTPIPSNGQ